jgi:hypothetical protein
MCRNFPFRWLLVAPLLPLAGACDGEVAAPVQFAACEADRDCADPDLCNGVERCIEGRCAAGAAMPEDAFACAADGTAVAECRLDAPCGPHLACPAPGAPSVAFVPAGLGVPVRWAGDGRGVSLEAAVAAPGAVPERWLPVDGDVVDLDALLPVATELAGAPVSLWFRTDSDCENEIHVADFARMPPPSPGPTEDATRDAAAWATAVDAADPRIVGWAVACLDLRPGARVDPAWLDPRLALGPAGLDPYDVLTLGEGGEATFALPFAIADGPGAELAVFENAVPDDFIELARIEVSTDGLHFAAFDTLSLTPDPVAAYDTMDARWVDGFAGPAPLGHGVPFDLARLHRHPAVLSGLVDLTAIRFVRITDVVGDGSELDSFGHPVWDPFPTWGSAGFDLDAIAVLAPDSGR